MGSQATVEMLNQLRSAELSAIQQYMMFHYTVEGPYALEYAELFKKIAIDEMKHAEAAAERITMLGGSPTEKPYKGITRPTSAEEMLKVLLAEEEEAIRMYKGFLADLPPDDPTTRRLIEEILADEERHADDARTILAGR